MKNFNNMVVYWKIQFLGEGIHQKPIYWEELPIKGVGGGGRELHNLQV